MRTVADVQPDRNAAGKFFEELKQHLNNRISPSEVREWIQKEKEGAGPTGKEYEGLFIDKFVLPAIPEYLGKALGLSPKDERVRGAFLAESDLAKKNQLTSGSPISAKKYLFTKVFGANSKSVVESWWGDSGKGATSQNCPDWAFRDPCPHTIFEGKFFRQGGKEAARTQLVSGIYQCFYYRAHPYAPEIGKHPAWDYEYACLFAYDASANGSLVEAWATLNKRAKDACWDTANIFVIVLPREK